MAIRIGHNDAGSASGYHLLVVEGYSHTKADVLNGDHISSLSFRVGGYLWSLQDVAIPVKAKYEFSFIDQTDRQEPSHILARKTYDFPIKSGGMSYPKFSRRDALEDSRYLKGDSFTIRCDVVVIGNASPFVTVPPPDMQWHFTDILMAKEGTDVTFKVGGETFPAHRCVLAARSVVFRAELFGPTKEGTPAASTILVEDMDAQVFRAMLSFIYSDSEPELEKGEDNDVIWQQLLVAADRYDLQRLKLMCEDKLCGFIEVNTTTTILEQAERHRCDGLKKACYDFLAGPGIVKSVMANHGFDHLISSAPSVAKELIAMFAP